MSGWLETYRGTVFRWEIDHNDHLTVAYYFSRFADAGLGLLEAIGLGPSYLAREGRGCPTVDCYVRYLRELRAGDILHILSGVIAVEAGGLLLGHRVLNSETDVLCATVEQRVAHVEPRRAPARARAGPGCGPAPVPLTAAQRRAAEARRVRWDGPPRERRPRPPGLGGFRDSARDTVKPWELDVFGRSALSFYIHRFSAANAHALAAFGLTPAYQREERRGFSTFEFQLAVAGGLRPGDAVAVRTGLLHVGTSSMRLLHRMFDERTGEEVAALDQLGVHLDMDARRPTPLPDALREKARAILVPTA